MLGLDYVQVFKKFRSVVVRISTVGYLLIVKFENLKPFGRIIGNKKKVMQPNML